jgi:dinuclear metal center YbgI/SA1388 family protein
MIIKDITTYLEQIAPLFLQESYDNAGLITGDHATPVTGSLICLDSTEAVIDEAIAMGCNLVIAHHPIVFSGIKKLNGKNYVERTVIKAIKNDIAIYAAHTNLDNINEGVNTVICDKLGLKNQRILAPKSQLLRKIVIFCPTPHAEQVKQAVFAAGAGHIGSYDECSFNNEGIGTFRPLKNARPYVGELEKQHREPETKIEVIYETYKEQNILTALLETHPYEEPAYDIITLENKHQQIGSGRIGELIEPEHELHFMQRLKSIFGAGIVKHTAFLNKKVKKIAVCGGSGSFLIKAAIAAGADAFITADVKYHEFFDADDKLLLADIGHYESEQFTKELFYTVLRKKFPTFAVHLSKINTNPIKYL